jgi:hypothetical protein
VDEKQLLEQILKALEKGGSSGFGPSADLAKAQKSIEDFTKLIKANTAELTKAQPLNKSIAQALSGQLQQVKDFSSEYKKLDKDLESYSKAIQNAKTREEQELAKGKYRALQEEKVALQSSQATQNVAAGLSNLTTSLGSVISGALINGSIDFAKGLQDGQSGIELYGNAAKNSAKGIAAGFTTVGDVATVTGEAMSKLPGPIGAVGAALMLLGPLIKLTASTMGKLSSEGLDMLQKEVQKTQKAFASTSSSGALFADGMTGMRNAAGAAGLTVNQFADVIKTHSADISAAGLGVTEGAKKVGGALSAGGPQMQKQLRNLGFSIEEQAGLVAETMKDMKGSSSGKFAASDQQVAEQTQKYAENLRVISAITGEDAKAKMKQVNEQANQLAFQQKLAKLGPEQQAATKRAMLNMSDIERKNFMDMVNFGSVINKEGAAAQALSQGLTNSVGESYAAFQMGQLDDTKQREIASKHADAIKTDLLNNEAIAQAGAAGVGGLVQGLSESMGKELQYRNANTKEAIEAAEKAAAAQKTTTDPLTSTVNSIETQAQKLKVSLEKELSPAIGTFSKDLLDAGDSVGEMLKKMGIKEKSTGEKVGTGVGIAAGGAGGAVAGAMAGAALGSVVPVLGTAIGGILGGILGATGGALVGGEAGSWLGGKAGDAMGSNIEKRATGGPVDANTPYWVGEHGPELFKPTSAGNIVSNETIAGLSGASATGSMSSSSSTVGASAGSGKDLSEILREQTEVLRQLLENSQSLTDSMRENVSGTHKLINVMS